jgi:hypothetical protein
LGQIVGRLVLIGLPLYFAWEMLQMPAFTRLPSGRMASTLMCALAAVLDTVLILLLYSIGALAFSDRLWFCPPRFLRYLLIVLVAIVANSVWEWVAVGRLGLWGYRAWHPAVFGVGLVAILQAVVMPALVFFWLGRWAGQQSVARPC